MAEHPHLATIRRYYDGCNTADVELMKSTFTPDVVDYFVEDPPIHGADAVAAYWLPFQDEGRRAVWSVDHGIAEGDEAVIEWTLLYTRPGKDPSTLLFRGAEWYFFREGLIREIRAYEAVGGDHAAELDSYPYAERGYPMLPGG